MRLNDLINEIGEISNKLKEYNELKEFILSRITINRNKLKDRNGDNIDVFEIDGKYYNREGFLLELFNKVQK